MHKGGIHPEIYNEHLSIRPLHHTPSFHRCSRVVIVELLFCKSLPHLVFYTSTLPLYALLPLTGELLQVCSCTEPGDGVSVVGSCSEPLGRDHQNG